MEDIGKMVAQFLDHGDMETVQQPSQPQMQDQGGSTMMRSCNATNCANLCNNGACGLELIDINEFGGCAMYAAKAADCGEEQGDQSSRYVETPQDPQSVISHIAQSM